MLNATTDKWWKFAESRAALFYEGDLVNGSGRGFLKSDVTQTEIVNGIKSAKKDGFRVEAKSTETDVFSLKTEILIKIIKEARKYRQHPAFYLLFGDNTGYAIYPTEIENEEITPDNTVNITGSSKTLSTKFLENKRYLKISRDVLLKNRVAKDAYYVWWKIVKDE